MENLKTYKLADDGSLLVADTSEQIVAAMRDSSKFAADQTLEAYMEGFADRYRVQTGNSVRCDTAFHFVADLLKFDYLQEIQAAEPANFI